MLKALVILILSSTFIAKSHSMSVSEVGESLQEFLSEEEEIAHKDEPRQIPKLSAVKSVDAAEAKAIIAETSATANKLVDFALDTIGKRLKKEGDDDLHLPEKDAQLNDRFWGIPLRASAKFFNGSLKGMQSIHRVGDSTLIDTNAEDSLATIAFTVELKDIEISYRLNVSLLKIGPDGRLTGKLKSMKINTKLNITQNGGVYLIDFDVLNTGLFTVSTTGFGPFNYIFSGVGAALGNLSKRMLLDSMEDKIRHRMNAALASMSNNSQKRSLIVMLKALLAERRRTVTAIPSITENYTSSEPTPTAHNNFSQNLNSKL